MPAGIYYSIIEYNNPLYLNILRLPFIVAFIIAKTSNYHILSIKKPFFKEEYIKNILNLSNDPIKTLEILEKEARDSSILKYYKHLDLYSFINLIISEESFHLDMVMKWFPEIENLLIKELFPVGYFKVFFGILNNEEKERIIYTIKKSSEIVEYFGFSSLLYGNIIMVEHIANRPRAAYNPGPDLIKLARKAAYTKNYNHSSIKSFIHELGHRAMEMGFIDRNACEIKYNKIIKENDIQWIPSKYSLKNYKEWFSEVFSYGLINDNKLYKEFIIKITKE